MENILIAQIIKNGVRSIFTSYEIDEDYTVYKHDSIEEFFFRNSNKLNEDTELIFVTKNLTQKMNDTIILNLRKYNYSKEYKIIDYEEAFVYFNIYFSRNIQGNNVQLLFQEDEVLEVYTMCKKIENYSTKIDIKKVSTELDLASVELLKRDEELFNILPGILDEKTQIVYLTSDAFTGWYLEKTLHLLCQSKRVFIEDNIFLLGAYSYIYNSKMEGKLEKYNIHSDEMCDINLSIQVKNSNGFEYINIITPKYHYYDEKKHIEVISFREDIINIRINDKHLQCCIETLRKRFNRPTRIKIDVGYILGTKNLKIVLTDIGFGKLDKPSGAKIVYYIRNIDDLDDNSNIINTDIRLCKQRRKNATYYCRINKREFNTIEELSYFIFENIHLLDEKFIDRQLVNFVKEAIGEDIKNYNLKDAITLILESNNMYFEDDINTISDILNNFNIKNYISRAKIMGDKCLNNKDYNMAIKHYDGILDRYKLNDIDSDFILNVLFNKGVTYARMLNFKDAFAIFRDLYDKRKDDEKIKLYYIISMKFFNENIYNEFIKNEDENYIKDIENLILEHKNNEISYTRNNRYMMFVDELINEWRNQVCSAIKS